MFDLMGNLYSAVDKFYFPIYLIQHYKYFSKIGVSPTCVLHTKVCYKKNKIN